MVEIKMIFGKNTIWLMCLLNGIALKVAAQAADVSIEEYDENSGRYTIEGKVYAPEIASLEQNWQRDTSISINNGEYTGFLADDGTFIISAVPSGSYVIEITNPDYLYESVSGSFIRKRNDTNGPFSIDSRRNQPEGQVSSSQIELRATVASRASSVSTEIEGLDPFQVFPTARAMEGL